jgi:large subunit ribosomal protein L24
MQTINPGKQRRHLYNAPLHKRRKWIAAHLEENLLLKYDKRSLPVIKGDTVRVMRGSFRGHEDKIAKVNVKKRSLEIEGITMAKANGNKIAKPIHPSNVLITKLNLTDKWRRKTIGRGLSEDVKKEIEKEAEEQIKKMAEEQKRLEEEQKALEKLAEEQVEGEDIGEEPIEETEKKEKEDKKPATKLKEKKEPVKKPEPKKEEKKQVEKPNDDKKPTQKEKKPVVKKPTEKKSPASKPKTQEKKGGSK